MPIRAASMADANRAARDMRYLSNAPTTSLDRRRQVALTVLGGRARRVADDPVRRDRVDPGVEQRGDRLTRVAGKAGDRAVLVHEPWLTREQQRRLPFARVQAALRERTAELRLADLGDPEQDRDVGQRAHPHPVDAIAERLERFRERSEVAAMGRDQHHAVKAASPSERSRSSSTAANVSSRSDRVPAKAR